MIDKELTILIPTFKRPDYIERLLDSFTAFKVFDTFSIYILDSSPIEFEKKYKEVIDKFKETLNITYYHYEVDIIFTKKLFLGVGLIKTPYVIIATDDDMLNPNAVIESVEQIKIHKDISNVTGEVLLIEKNSKKNFVTHYMPNKIANQEKAIERGWHNSFNRSLALITLNNVWRKNDLYKILETLSYYSYKKYTECMYNLLSSYTGKTLLIPKIMILRTRNLSREAYRKTSLPKFNEKKSNVFHDPNFQSDLKRFLETSNKILHSNKENLEKDNFDEILISQFINRFMHYETFIKENKLLKKIKNSFLSAFFLKILRRIRFLKIVLYPKNLLILLNTIELYGYSETNTMMNKDPKMKFNILSLLKDQSKNGKDFNIIFEFIKKYENKIEL